MSSDDKDKSGNVVNLNPPDAAAKDKLTGSAPGKKTEPTKKTSNKVLRVRSKAARFRRCGREFSRDTVILLDELSRADVAELQAEPALIVEEDVL